MEGDSVDKGHMRRAIELASTAVGRTNPNPCVGCVLVDSNNEVVGEGFHHRAGEPHAEVMAIRDCILNNKSTENTTAYVSLEPCSHYGRTPPCTLTLINNGIRRVVSGMVDPDSRVSGSGLQYLRDNDVDVVVGVLHDECEKLNRGFVHRIVFKKPYIIQVKRSSIKRDSLAVVINKAIAENNDVDTVVLSDEILLDPNLAIMDKIPSHVAIVTKISVESNVEKIKSSIDKSKMDRKIIYICSKGMSKTLSISDTANATIFVDSIDTLTAATLQQIASFGSNVVLFVEDESIEAQNLCYIDDVM